MKIVFFGTPDFACPSLQKLINSKYEVVAVVTQLDTPKGRSGKLQPSPVKVLAQENNIKVFQYKSLKLEGVDDLKSLNADIFVTCAYGQILSQEILDIAPLGVINVHGSLLPKYRGAAPIQWAIINGEETTGITILKTQIGLDDGPIILKKEIKIEQYETAEELFKRLSHIGADCLLDALQLIENNKATYTPQNEIEATLCKMLKKEYANINFNLSAKSIINLVHGLNPWPVAQIYINNNRFKIYRAELCNLEQLLNKGFNIDFTKLKNGEIVIANSKIGLIIKANDGLINIVELQAENGKKMLSKSYLNGKQIKVGTIVNE